MTREERAFADAMANMPDTRPRDPAELAELERVWQPPRGWRILSVVNNSYIGPIYLGTALLFFVLAGVLGLLIRLQLALPMAEVLGQDTYNQVFTMHGVVMLFLFAVPAVEAMGVLLLPQMLAARDMPFPRLSAFAYWAYAIGGLAFFSSIFFGQAPDGGWFMYPPLTGKEYSPGNNVDWFLLGIGFIEISAIAGAIEIIVGLMKTRAPGMTLDKMPLFAWAMLIFACMIVVAFPAVILCTVLLEMERLFDWPFFIAARGGDPMLWQHLFWFFGHPEVYIIFLPAAGMVSMLVATMARHEIVGYRFAVLAIIATAFISFGVWAHHMFTTGLPDISVSFFSAASMAVSIPAGVQVFAWIATLMVARKVRLSVPGLFVLGFLMIFTMGGLTGVMLAMVPFDWQAHDSYFVVAHFHYILVGGMVFPLVGAIYYWAPMAGKRALDERLGRWVFWLLFAGTHLTFLVMHWTGFMGMPRRVYTYLPEQGITFVNLFATMGAFVFAAGVALFAFDLFRRFRIGNGAGNPYDGGTLEWLPNGQYSARSIPFVTARQPLWDRPEIAREVEKGQWFLPRATTGRRETLVTSTLTATPQYVMIVATDSWWPFTAAIGTAGFFLLLVFEAYVVSFLFGFLAIAAIFQWMKGADKGADHPPVDVGGGLMLPVYATGAKSHGVWAIGVLIVVLAMIFASALFGYFLLWSGRPDAWPAPGTRWPGPALILPAALIVGGWLFARAFLKRVDRRPYALLAAAVACMLGGWGLEIWTYGAHDIWPTQSGYAAIVNIFPVLTGKIVIGLALYAWFVALKMRRGEVSSQRRLSVECMVLLWGYATIQGVVGMAVVGLSPLVLS